MKKNQAICRGKTVGSDQWAIGYYVDCGASVIFDKDADFADLVALNNCVFVYPETVGRMLEYPCYDSNYENKEFFQGDIIQVWNNRFTDIHSKTHDHLAIVVDEHTIMQDNLGLRFPQDTTRVKVVGNIYDNPNLVSELDLMNYSMYVNDTPDNYSEQRSKIMATYNVDGSVAGCYLCNYDPRSSGCYLCCHLASGECKHINECYDIFRKEHQS